MNVIKSVAIASIIVSLTVWIVIAAGVVGILDLIGQWWLLILGCVIPFFAIGFTVSYYEGQQSKQQ